MLCLDYDLRSPRWSPSSSIEEGWFVSADGIVSLTDCNGLPLGAYNRRLGHGEDELRVAQQLLRAKAKRAPFSGPFYYDDRGWSEAAVACAFFGQLLTARRTEVKLRPVACRAG